MKESGTATKKRRNKVKKKRVSRNERWRESEIERR
jgi:hypothetical protein